MHNGETKKLLTDAQLRQAQRYGADFHSLPTVDKAARVIAFLERAVREEPVPSWMRGTLVR